MDDDVSRRVSQVSLLAKGHYRESVRLGCDGRPPVFVTNSRPAAKRRTKPRSGVRMQPTAQAVG
jgi:hypothetical protein